MVASAFSCLQDKVKEGVKKEKTKKKHTIKEEKEYFIISNDTLTLSTA